MIVKIHRSGRSFKGVIRYLTHDVGKDTAERVAWTKTLNLAEEEHVPTAVHEMLWTYRAADQLKRAAGISTGGTKLERPVKHFTIGWHESDPPSATHMLETVRGYLKHMGWDDRQAILVAHSDKAHSHVHVVLNVVSPEDGRALKDSHEWLRTEDFCLAYERQHGRIFCEQRLQPREQRTPAPTRTTWQQLRRYEKDDDRAELSRSMPTPDYEQRSTGWQDREWKLLKGHLRQERDAFFAEGRALYREARNQAYREVRAEFRDEWKSFYARKRAGMDKDLLAEWKERIIADQKERLAERKQEHCGAKRKERDQEYVALLKRQSENRAELRDRQKTGQRTYGLLDRAYPDTPLDPAPQRRGPLHEKFHGAAAEIATATRTKQARETKRRPNEARASAPRPPQPTRQRLRDPLDIAGGVGLGALGAVAELGERLFDGFLGGTPAPKQEQQVPEHTHEDERRENARDSSRQQTASERGEAEQRESESYWDRRRARSRGRD